MSATNHLCSPRWCMSLFGSQIEGTAGVDEQSLEEFEQDPKGNLYLNRMSSGTYFHPVKAVPIPKKSGGTRVLGVPTVSDRALKR